MIHSAINLDEKFRLLTDLWSPRIIAQMNDYHFKLVRLHGEFVWHSHPDTDEAFLVLGGTLTIELRDGAVDLSAGELFVVPRATEHRPVAKDECLLMLIEPAGTPNTGDAGGPRTAPTDAWI